MTPEPRTPGAMPGAARRAAGEGRLDDIRRSPVTYSYRKASAGRIFAADHDG